MGERESTKGSGGAFKPLVVLVLLFEPDFSPVAVCVDKLDGLLREEEMDGHVETLGELVVSCRDK
jgi:hypothetical protein